jgi:hypothetical protein
MHLYSYRPGSARPLHTCTRVSGDWLSPFISSSPLCSNATVTWPSFNVKRCPQRVAPLAGRRQTPLSVFQRFHRDFFLKSVKGLLAQPHKRRQHVILEFRATDVARLILPEERLGRHGSNHNRLIHLSVFILHEFPKRTRPSAAKNLVTSHISRLWYKPLVPPRVAPPA